MTAPVTPEEKKRRARVAYLHYEVARDLWFAACWERHVPDDVSWAFHDRMSALWHAFLKEAEAAP